MAQTRQQAEQQQQQLDQLKAYRSEYVQQLEGGSGGQPIAARQLGDFRQFLSNLNNAIDQQKLSVENSSRNFQASQQVWLEARQRVQALSKAIEKQQDHEQFLENRREQAETDERASRSGNQTFTS